MRLFNRFTPPEDGWFHFIPKGEFPWIDLEDPTHALIQVVDDEALRSIAEQVPAEMLIDQDHFSLDPTKPTTAMGWAYGPESAQIRPDGLYVKPKLTEAGLTNIQGGNLRYVSPVFDEESAVLLGTDERTGLPRYRVTRMTDAALTNKPNLKGLKPLSNRGTNAPGGEHGRKDPAATKENQTTMKLVNRALDLSPDASEDAAIAGIETLKKSRADIGLQLANREKELDDAKKLLVNRETELTELNKKLAAAAQTAVEAELTAAGITDEAERKSFGSLLLANRETGKAALDAVVAARKEAADAKAKATAPLTNRQTAKTPAGKDEKSELTGIARTRAALEAERGSKEEN